MELKNEQALFQHELQDIYYAEQKLVEALGQQAAESTRADVRAAFETHRQETANQVRRLEQAFQLLGQQPSTTVCYGVEGLIKEKQSASKEHPSAQILDMINLSAAVKVERYEISSYEGLIQMGTKLGLSDVVQLLQQNLQEEQATLQKVQALSKADSVQYTQSNAVHNAPLS